MPGIRPGVARVVSSGNRPKGVKLFKEFREFALKGSLLDVAVGFVLGAAFATVMTSLVENVLTPLIAGIGGQPDFSALVLEVGEAEIRYGLFLNALIAFILVAIALFFFVVKPANAMRNRFAREEAVEDAGPSDEAVLLAEIRDELRRRP